MNLRPMPSSVRARGFTLIEMAIVITIMGLLMVAFSAFWKVYVRQMEREKNNVAVTQITAAINKYYNDRGFYPCPAPPLAPVGNATRGEESRYVLNTQLPAAATPIEGVIYGRCNIGPSANAAGAVNETDATTGIIRVGGHRVDPATKLLLPNQIVAQSGPGPTAAANTADTTVFIGAVPYVTLGLPEKYTYDSWGRKFTYVVSATVTHNDTFNVSNPNFTVQTFDYARAAPPWTVVDQNTSGLYAVFSGGADGLGVYTQQAALANPCGGAVTQASISGYSRRENCDNDAIFLTGGASNKFLGMNRNSTTHYFDDIIEYQTGTGSSIWEPVPNSTSNVRNTNIGNIGLGTNPNTYVKLDVSGAVRADKLIANQLCHHNALSGTGINAVSPHCFSPSLIAGDPDLAVPTGGMKCPAGQAVEKIKNGALVCVVPSLTIPMIANKICGVGLWVTGFDPVGNICCTGDPPPCP